MAAENKLYTAEKESCLEYKVYSATTNYHRMPNGNETDTTFEFKKRNPRNGSSRIAFAATAWIHGLVLSGYHSFASVNAEHIKYPK